MMPFICIFLFIQGGIAQGDDTCGAEFPTGTDYSKVALPESGTSVPQNANGEPNVLNQNLHNTEISNIVTSTLRDDTNTAPSKGPMKEKHLETRLELPLKVDYVFNSPEHVSSAQLTSDKQLNDKNQDLINIQKSNMLNSLLANRPNLASKNKRAPPTFGATSSDQINRYSEKLKQKVLGIKCAIRNCGDFNPQKKADIITLANMLINMEPLDGVSINNTAENMFAVLRNIQPMLQKTYYIAVMTRVIMTRRDTGNIKITENMLELMPEMFLVDKPDKTQIKKGKLKLSNNLTSKLANKGNTVNSPEHVSSAQLTTDKQLNEKNQDLINIQKSDMLNSLLANRPKLASKNKRVPPKFGATSSDQINRYSEKLKLKLLGIKCAIRNCGDFDPQKKADIVTLANMLINMEPLDGVSIKNTAENMFAVFRNIQPMLQKRYYISVMIRVVMTRKDTQDIKITENMLELMPEMFLVDKTKIKKGKRMF